MKLNVNLLLAPNQNLCIKNNSNGLLNKFMDCIIPRKNKLDSLFIFPYQRRHEILLALNFKLYMKMTSSAQKVWNDEHNFLCSFLMLFNWMKRIKKNCDLLRYHINCKINDWRVNHEKRRTRERGNFLIWFALIYANFVSAGHKLSLLCHHFNDCESFACQSTDVPFYHYQFHSTLRRCSSEAEKENDSI